MTTRISQATASAIAAAWPRMLDQIAEGELSITEATKAAGFSRAEIRAYRAMSPQHDADWERAKEDRAHACADKVFEIANNSGGDAGIARVKMDAWRWLASKYYPHAYSDKAQLDVNVKTLDLTAIVQAANQRLAAARAGRVIDAQVVDDSVPALRDLL